MYKTLLIDVDGVLLPDSRNFSQIFAETQGIPYEKLAPFFEVELKECGLGKKDLLEILPAYLNTWGFKKTPEDFLNYWFGDNNRIDEELLKAIQIQRQNGSLAYVATNQEKHRGEHLNKHLNIRSNFDGSFVSYQLGVGKDKPEFFQNILDTLDIPADEILYFDDDQKNLDSASKVGITGKLYQTIDDFYENFPQHSFEF